MSAISELRKRDRANLKKKYFGSYRQYRDGILVFIFVVVVGRDFLPLLATP